MLDSIYHIPFKLLKNLFFWQENVEILPAFMQHYNARHCVTLLNLSTTSGLIYCMALYHSQTQNHVINKSK